MTADREGWIEPALRRFATVVRPDAVLAALLALSAALLLVAGRHLTFFYDEWAFALSRRGSGLSTLLDDHGGHLVVFPVLIYKLFFATVGLRHYLPYQLTMILLHLVSGALLYALARRRLGGWLALVPTLLLLFLGNAWQDLLWPFQISYLGSVAAGLGALLLLDRPRSAHPALAAVLLMISLGCSGVGLSFLAAALTLLLMRSGWTSLWVVAAPLSLYLLWYAGYASPEHVTSDGVLSAPDFVAGAAATAMAAIAGLDTGQWGPPLAVAVVGLLVAGHRRRAPSPLFIAALGGVLVFWLLTAVVRSDPGASRYVYVGVVFLLLMAVEMPISPARPLRPGWGMALTTLALLVAVVGNVAVLRRGERSLRASDDSVRASLSAVEVAAPVVAPDFVPDLINAPQLHAGGFLAAVHDLGSPAPGPTVLAAQPESFRRRADTVLASAEQLVGRVGRAEPPAVDALLGGSLTRAAGCVTFTPRAALGALQLTLRSGDGLRLGAHPHQVSLYLRRYAGEFGEPPAGGAGPNQPLRLAAPTDREPQLPWHAQFSSAGRLTVCGGD